jgi:hypothetical protein
MRLVLAMVTFLFILPPLSFFQAEGADHLRFAALNVFAHAAKTGVRPEGYD